MMTSGEQSCYIVCESVSKLESNACRHHITEVTVKNLNEAMIFMIVVRLENTFQTCPILSGTPNISMRK